MHFVWFVIEGASLVFITAMAINEDISAQRIFGILYSKASATVSVTHLGSVHPCIQKDHVGMKSAHTTAFRSRRSDCLLSRDEACGRHRKVGIYLFLLRLFIDLGPLNRCESFTNVS